MEDAPKYEVGKLMELLARLSSIFDSSHYYCMEVKRRIIENIGRNTILKFAQEVGGPDLAFPNMFNPNLLYLCKLLP